MQHCVDGVESVHDAVHRTWPDAFTASVNEPCDIGADYSTFDFFRRGEVPPIPDSPDGLPHVTERFVRPHKDYAWSTVVDHMGTEQAVGIWSGTYRDVDYPRPVFMWCNFTLTDSAFHVGGPHSEIADASVRDTDARIGEVLDAVERAGVFDDTAFVLVADHGMQQTDPAVTGDWDVCLPRRRHSASATRATASSTSTRTDEGEESEARADEGADEVGDGRDDRADDGHAQAGAARVAPGEDRRGRAHREQRERPTPPPTTTVAAVPLPNRNGRSGSNAPSAKATNDEIAATHGDPSFAGSRPSSSRASVSSATSSLVHDPLGELVRGAR